MKRQCLIAAIFITIISASHSAEVSKAPLAVKAEIENLAAENDPVELHMRKVVVTVKFPDLPKNVAAIDRRARVLKAKTNSGLELQGVTLPESVANNGGTSVTFELTVPDKVKTLSSVECSVVAFLDAERKTFVWNVDKLLSEAKTFQGFEFKPTRFETDGQKTIIDTFFKDPDSAIRGLMAPKFVLICDDDTRLENYNGHGGTQNREHDQTTEFSMNKKKPAKFEVSFNYKARVEELHFTLNEVKLPPAPADAAEKAAPIGPRGKNLCESEGFAFKVKNFNLQPGRDDHPGAMYLTMEAAPGNGVKVALSPVGVKLDAVVDDLGKKLSNPNDRMHAIFVEPYSLKMLRQLQLNLEYPSAGADRLVKLAGKFPVYIEDEAVDVEFDLPPNKQNLVEAITKNGVTLTALQYEGKKVTLKYSLPSKALFRGPRDKWLSKSQLINADFSLFPSRHPDELGRVNGDVIEVTESCEVYEWSPLKCAIHYVTKASYKEVPFEFKDLGLPRKPGYTKYEELEADAAWANSGIVQRTPEPGVETVHINRVEVETESSSMREGKITLNLKASFDGYPKKPFAAMTTGRCYSARNADGPIKFESYASGVYYDPAPNCLFRITLPDHVQKLDEVELGIPILHVVESHELKWKVSTENNQTQKYEGWEFTPKLETRGADEMAFDLEYLVPKGMDRLFTRVQYKLLDTNGKPLQSAGGGGGGLGDNKYHNSGVYKLNGRKPESFEVTFNAKAKEEELHFGLKNITVPTAATFRAPNIPVGPRGSKSVEAEGWTFNVRSVELSHSNDPSLRITFNARPPAGFKLAQSKNWVQATKATDDLGNKFENLSTPSSFNSRTLYEGTVMGVFTLSFPAANADRITSLRCNYPVLVEDESQTVEFDIPADKKGLAEPIVKGPVTFSSLSYSDNFLTVKCLMDKSTRCTSPPCSQMYNVKVLDTDGNELKMMGSGGHILDDTLKGEELYQKVKLDGKTPAKVTIWYCNKVHLVEIPFEFKDLGLPRKLGKWDVEKTQF